MSHRVLVKINRGTDVSIPEHLLLTLNAQECEALANLLDISMPFGSLEVTWPLPDAKLCHVNSFFEESLLLDGNTIGNFLEVNGYCVLPENISAPVIFFDVFGYVSLVSEDKIKIKCKVKEEWPCYECEPIDICILTT